MQQPVLRVLEALPDAVILLGPTGEIEFANRQTLGLFGFSKDELIGQSVGALLPERLRSSHMAELREFLDGPRAGNVEAGLELIGLRKDGSEFPVDLSLAPLPNDEGIKAIAVIRDLSETPRERAMEALREVAVSASGILDPPDLARLVVERTRSLMHGDDATLLWWEPAASGLHVLADTFIRTFPRNVAIGEGTAGIAFRSGEPVVVEDYPHWEHAVPDALVRGMKSVVAVPLLVRTRPVGALTVSFTTARQFSQEDLRLLTLLAAQVAPALEAARLYDALVQTNSQLLEASAAKSRFLANMSHELRTPLNAIIGFTELLIEEPSAGYKRARRMQFLHQIHQSGQHLLELINEILDLAKVAAGQMKLRLSAFDLGDLITSVIDTVRPLAQSKNLKLDAETGAGSSLFADEGRVRQILLNLLSNAIKFTPEGGSVSVSVAHLEDAVIVCVADTGIGIAAADQEHLFREFEQLGAGSASQQGSGLGLALTKRLAELHGGRVWVESEPGVGSRFFVRLPLRATEMDVADATAEIAEQPTGPLVMIVEDEVTAATLLTFTLRRAGYRVAVARSEQEALEKAVSLRPYAITLDILLPEPDGWDVLRSLKEIPETRDIPVVVISNLDDRSLGFALGADEYLVKPLAREALWNFLARFGFTGKAQEREVRILAVDDDPAALGLLKETLEPQFTVLMAGDGTRGIELAASEHPDAVVLDLVMPGLSGFEVAAALKADPATREIPILVLTAKDLTEADRARLNGHVRRIMRKGEVGIAELLGWLQGLSMRGI